MNRYFKDLIKKFQYLNDRDVSDNDTSDKISANVKFDNVKIIHLDNVLMMKNKDDGDALLNHGTNTSEAVINKRKKLKWANYLYIEHIEELDLKNGTFDL